MSSYSKKSELGPSSRNEKEDGRVEECNQGKDRLEPRMPNAIKVSSTSTRAVR